MFATGEYLLQFSFDFPFLLRRYKYLDVYLSFLFLVILSSKCEFSFDDSFLCRHFSLINTLHVSQTMKKIKRNQPLRKHVSILKCWLIRLSVVFVDLNCFFYLKQNTLHESVIKDVTLSIRLIKI